MYARIRSGEYPLGSDLPTEVQLVAELKASHHTVRHALRLLSDKGLVVRRAGSGSKVIASQENTVFSNSVSSLKHLLRYPPTTYREIVDSGHIEADAEQAALLGCDVGTPWFRMRCLRWDVNVTKPICWSDIYLLPRYASIVKSTDHATTPLWEQVERDYGVRVERASLEFSTVLIDAERARLLQTPPATPAVVITRRYYTRDDDLFELTVSTHPQGNYTYTLEFKREVKLR
ncbi:GntR family transcriptional regulator [soil metagenome]